MKKSLLNSGLLWERLLSYSEDPERLHLWAEDVDGFYTLKLVDAQKLPKVKMQKSLARYRKGDHYVIEAEAFEEFTKPFSWDKLKDYFEPERLKEGNFPKEWLEHFYENVLAHLTTLEEEDWKETLKEMQQRGLISPQGIKVNAAFKGFIFDLLVAKPSSLRELELKIHFHANALKEYYAEHNRALQKMNQSTYVQEDKNDAQQLKKITRAGEQTHPTVEDKELIDLLDDLTEKE